MPHKYFRFLTETWVSFVSHIPEKYKDFSGSPSRTQNLMN